MTIIKKARGGVYKDYGGAFEDKKLPPSPPPIPMSCINRGWSDSPPRLAGDPIPNPPTADGYWTTNTPMVTFSDNNRTVDIQGASISSRADVGSVTSQTKGIRYFQLQLHAEDFRQDNFGIMLGKMAQTGSTLPYDEFADGTIITIGTNFNFGYSYLWVRTWVNGTYPVNWGPSANLINPVMPGDRVGFKVDLDLGKVLAIDINGTEVIPAQLVGADLTNWNTYNQWVPNSIARIHAQQRRFNVGTNRITMYEGAEDIVGLPAGAIPFSCTHNPPAVRKPDFLETFTGTGSAHLKVPDVAPAGVAWSETWEDTGAMIDGKYVAIDNGYQELRIFGILDENGEWVSSPVLVEVFKCVEFKWINIPMAWDAYCSLILADTSSGGPAVTLELTILGSELTITAGSDVHFSIPLDPVNGIVIRLEFDSGGPLTPETPTGFRTYINNVLRATTVGMTGVPRRFTEVELRMEGKFDYLYVDRQVGFHYPL